MPRFLQVGIGYRVLGGIKFYERAEIKDAVSYLRIINQKYDDLALERVIGSPKRGVGDSTLNQIYLFGNQNKLCLEDSIIKILEKGDFKPKIKNTLKQLINMIHKWRKDSINMKHYDLLKLVLDESGYSAMLKNKKELQKGKIGRLEKVIITSRDPAPPPLDYLKVSGGIFKDMMIHDFDLARFYLEKDEIESIFSTGSNISDKKFDKIKDYELASCILRSKKGVQCIITNSRHCSFGYDQRVELFGSKGMLSFLVSLQVDNNYHVEH